MSVVSLYPDTHAARASEPRSWRHRVSIVGQRPRIEGALAPWRVAGRLAATVALWHARARARRELARLDAHLLRDIGLDRNTARFEAAKPFWRA
ncbi:MAG: DUF1127 domain-containing protein [Azospirillaceae bacterium]